MEEECTVYTIDKYYNERTLYIKCVPLKAFG